VVGVDNHLDVPGARFGDRVQDVVEHGAAANRVEDLGDTRSHSGAVTGGEYDGRQRLAQTWLQV
jgi:hypothetical protein